MIFKNPSAPAVPLRDEIPSVSAKTYPETQYLLFDDDYNN
jgi:hypothetical protein